MKKALLFLFTGLAAISAHAQWTNTGEPSNTIFAENYIESDGSRLFLSCGDEVYVSTDHGDNWVATATKNNTISMTGPYNKLLWDNNFLYVVSSSGIYVSADNGSSWTADTAGIGPMDFNYVYNFHMVNGKLYLTGNKKMLFKTPGSSNPWTSCTGSITVGNEYYIHGVTFHNNKVMAVSITGGIHESADGIDFTKMASSGFPSTNDDVYTTSNQLVSFNNKLIANNIGALYESSDNGSTFTKINFAWPNWITGSPYLRKMTIIDNRLYVSSHKDSLFYTTDGSNFTSMSDGTDMTDMVRSLIKHNGSFYATQGNNAKVIKYGGAPGGMKTASTAAPSVYPNPASENITLQNLGNGPLQVRIYQNDGRLVFEQTIENPTNNQQLQLPALAKGSYWINTSQDNNKFTQSLIIR